MFKVFVCVGKNFDVSKLFLYGGLELESKKRKMQLSRRAVEMRVGSVM